MKNGYGDDTWAIFEVLTRQNLKVAEENGKAYLQIPEEDFNLQMRKYSQIAEEFLNEVRKPYEKKRELAQRLHVNQSVLSAVTSDKSNRRLTRNVVLSSLFSLSPVPTVDQVNHKLMELMVPGLYTETFLVKENQRNWILHEILKYAGERRECPMESWLDYANAVLKKLRMELLICEKNGCTLPEAELARVKEWRSQLDSIGFVDFTLLRRKRLQDYRKEHGLDRHGGRKKAFEKLEQESGIAFSSVETVFGTLSNRNSDVPPETLIPVMAVMGCTLTEVNEMLLQSNHELIYYASRDAYVLNWIGRLVENSQR